MDFTETLREIMNFCESNNVTSYYELKAYAFDHDKDDWISVLNNKKSRTPLRYYLQSAHRIDGKPYKSTMCEALEEAITAEKRYNERHMTA